MRSFIVSIIFFVLIDVGVVEEITGRCPRCPRWPRPPTTRTHISAHRRTLEIGASLCQVVDNVDNADIADTTAILPPIGLPIVATIAAIVVPPTCLPLRLCAGQ